MKRLYGIISVMLFCACSSEQQKPEVVTTPVLADSTSVTVKDTVAQTLKPVLSGLDMFIDSMKNTGYLIDTNRLKEVSAWYEAARSPKAVSNGHLVALMPFPDEAYSKYLTDPKTYFFAQWNEEKKTFRNGDDYILMTWTINNAGIQREREIYGSLHSIMGNFPCYIFRSKNTVYALGHRMTVNATGTRKLAGHLRVYIDTTSILYRPFGGMEPG